MPPLERTRKCIRHFPTKFRRSLHGHGIIIPGWIQLLIWILGVTGFAWLTVKFSLPLLSHYYDDDENVAIKTTIVVNEETAQPQFVLVIRHFILVNEDLPLMRTGFAVFDGSADNASACQDCVRLKNASWDVWRNMDLTNTTSHDIIFELIAAFVRRLLEDIENGDPTDPLSESNSDWNAPIIDASLGFIIWKNELDRTYQPIGDTNRGDIAALDEEYSENSKQKMHVYDVFYERAMRALCRRMDFQWQGMNWQDWAPNCEGILLNGTLPILLYASTLYFPLELAGNMTQYKWSAADIVNNDSMWIVPEEEETSSILGVWTEPLLLYATDIDTFRTELNTQLAAVSIAAGKAQQISISYSVVMRTLEERKSKMETCSRENDPKLCLTKCSKVWIRDNCQCQPFSFKKGLKTDNKDLPYCSANSYEACDPRTNFTKADEEQCMKLCYAPCNYTSYNYNVMVKEQQIDTPVCVIMINQIMTTFIQFSNTTKDDLEDMISQIGGMFGLWLGMSGLSILQFLVTCAYFVQRNAQKSKEQTKKQSWAVTLFRVAALKMLMPQSTIEDDENNQGKDNNRHENDNKDQENNSDDQESDAKSEMDHNKAKTIGVLKNQIRRQNELLQDLSEALEENSKMLKDLQTWKKTMESRRNEDNVTYF